MSSTCICNEVYTVDYADMVIQDQLVRGIADQEILADLLGDEKSDRLTSDIVDFIARKEQAKSECGTVAGDSTAARVIAQKQGGRPCGGCGGPDHGGRAQRLNNCPAKYTTCERCQVKGHYTKKCIKCSDCQQWGHGSNKPDKPETVGTIVEDNINWFVMPELAHITSRADIRLASVGNSKGRYVPLTHHMFKEDAGWTAMPSAPHPTMAMSTTASPNDHNQFGHQIADTKGMHSKMQTILQSHHTH